MSDQLSINAQTCLNKLYAPYFAEALGVPYGWRGRSWLCPQTGLHYDDVKKAVKELKRAELINTQYRMPLWTGPLIRISYQGIAQLGKQ